MMERIDLDLRSRALHLFRDPFPDQHRYQDLMWLTQSMGNSDNYKYLRATIDTEDRLKFNINVMGGYVGEVFHRWWLMYAVGEPLERCLELMHVDQLVLQELASYRATYWGFGDKRCTPFLYGTGTERDLAAICFWCLIEPDPTRLRQFLAWRSEGWKLELPAMDYLLDSFKPDGVKRPAKYEKAASYQALWDSLMRALAPEGPKAKSQGMARYMAGWNQRMKPLGWKPKRVYCPLAEDGRQVDPKCQGDQLFYRFAFEAALAVCAFDLDDSAFCDHPYYPRDLVAHYRAHVRQQRDGWRAVGAAPRFAVPLPPPLKKSDLTKKKFSGLKRWVELGCDGNLDAHAAVLDVLQGARSLNKNSENALGALSDASQCLCADIKDDATVQALLEGLLDSRGLGKRFDCSTDQGHGAQRAQALLDDAQSRLRESGSSHRLLLIDMGWDNLHALLVSQDFVQEFVDLSDQLGFSGKIKF